MNVLVIPSWYPHRCFPKEGGYVRDQAMAIGELREDWSVGLALWHQGRNLLTPQHALRSPRCAVDALLDHAQHERELRPNVVEWVHPALQFSQRIQRILAGNRDGLLASVRDSARRMTARCGSIDVLHAHVSYPAGWIAMRLSEELRVPFVITEHMGPFPLPVYRRPDGTLPDYIREPLERADARIAVSPTLAAEIAAHGFERPDAVPNVVDERRFDHHVTGDPATFTFFTACKMVRAKGVQDLLAAARRFLDRLTPVERARVRFRLSGEGPDMDGFRQQATRLGLGPHVTWIVKFDAPGVSRHGFETCDCFVLPSHHESFGIVFTEAMACGKPVIATRCGGPEAIVRPESGLLLDVGDVDALADALEHMFRHAHEYDRERIRADFERRFSRAVIVNALEAIYERVRAQRARRHNS